MRCQARGRLTRISTAASAPPASAPIASARPISGTAIATMIAIATRPSPPIPATLMCAMLMTSVDNAAADVAAASRDGTVADGLTRLARRRKAASTTPPRMPGIMKSVAGSTAPLYARGNVAANRRAALFQLGPQDRAMAAALVVAVAADGEIGDV